MKILRYKIEVTTDVIHGWKSIIDEVYVPDADLFINKETCFIGGEDNKDRVPKEFTDLFKIETEEVSDSLGIYIIRLANALKDQAGVEDSIRHELFKEKT